MPKYQFHEYAEVFPVMEESDLDELAADIKKYGQRETILLYDGKILDGRNRYLACLKARVEPRVAAWGGDCDLIALIRSKNIFRRHLTAVQRAQFIVELASLLPHGGDRKSDQVAKLQLDNRTTQKQMATEAKVSARTVSDAVKIKNKGVPGLVEAVKRGQVSGQVAAIAANLKPAKQRKLVEKGPEAIIEAARLVAANAPFSAPPRSSFMAPVLLGDGSIQALRFHWKHADEETRAIHRKDIREEMRQQIAPANGKTDQFGRPHAVPGTLLKGGRA